MVKYEIIKEREPTVEDRLAAAACLSGAGFKLYCYLESTSLYMRPYVIEFLKISSKTVDKAFEELIEKGYLQQLSPLRFQFNGKIP